MFALFAIPAALSSPPLMNSLNSRHSTLTINASDQTSFAWTLANTLNQVVAEAANSGPAGTKQFATKQAQVSEAGMLYTLAQCTPDLSIEDCGRCLHDAITDIASCCLGKAGGRVEYPSCRLRFELYKFYWNFSILPTPPTPLRLPAGSGLKDETNFGFKLISFCVQYNLKFSTKHMLNLSLIKGKRKIGSQMIVVIIVSAVVSVMIFGLGGYFLRKRARKSVKAILRENFGNATTTLGSLQFNLATIEAATNKFSHENKIGKGASGEVYKWLYVCGMYKTRKIF